MHRRAPVVPTLLCGFAMALLAAGATWADAAPPPSAPSPGDKALVQTAEDYILSLKGAAGRFTQTDPKGQTSTGRFFMLKPGKARFEYDPPASLLVVADGETVSVYDKRLKSFDQYPLAQTPLALLLSRDVKLNDKIAATAEDKTPKGFVLDLRDAKHPGDGRLLLAFASEPLALTGWTVIDAQNQRTTVRLSGLKRQTTFDPSLFSLKNPPPPGQR